MRRMLEKLRKAGVVVSKATSPGAIHLEIPLIPDLVTGVAKAPSEGALLWPKTRQWQILSPGDVARMRAVLAGLKGWTEYQAPRFRDLADPKKLEEFYSGPKPTKLRHTNAGLSHSLSTE